MGKLLVKNTNLYNVNSTSSNTLPSATQIAGSDDDVLNSLYVNNTVSHLWNEFSVRHGCGHTNGPHLLLDDRMHVRRVNVRIGCYNCDLRSISGSKNEWKKTFGLLKYRRFLHCSRQLTRNIMVHHERWYLSSE